MFALFKKSPSAAPADVTRDRAPPTLAAPEPAPEDSSAYPALLQRWMSLAGMQQRVIAALTREVTGTSDFVEAEADALSQRFQSLAVGSQQQMARADALTTLAVGVDVGNAIVSVDDIAAMLEQTLSEVVSKILHLSKDSMAMVYALDDLSSNVKRVEKCLAGINEINRVTSMLAMNARIEAERAGQAGMTFRVVADEVRVLSKSMQQLSTTMNGELQSIISSIAVGHETLKKVATVDMSGNIMVKERLDTLLPALVRRNGELRVLVAQSADVSSAISSDIDQMVTGIQFQDRTKQRLEHVVNTLGMLGDAINDTLTETASLAPELAAIAETDTDWVQNLLARCTMTDVQQRFNAHLNDDDAAIAAQASSGAGSIELF